MDGRFFPHAERGLVFQGSIDCVVDETEKMVPIDGLIVQCYITSSLPPGGSWTQFLES